MRAAHVVTHRKLAPLRDAKVARDGLRAVMVAKVPPGGRSTRGRTTLASANGRPSWPITPCEPPFLRWFPRWFPRWFVRNRGGSWGPLGGSRGRVGGKAEVVRGGSGGSRSPLNRRGRRTGRRPPLWRSARSWSPLWSSRYLLEVVAAVAVPPLLASANGRPSWPITPCEPPNLRWFRRWFRRWFLKN